MIKAKKDFIIQKMMDAYMILAVGDSADTYKFIIQTNKTGAFLWSMLEKGTYRDEMVSACLEYFDNLSKETAQQDIDEFLKGINAAIVEE